MNKYSAILIRFGDNDFYSTWMEVLKSLVGDKTFFHIKNKEKLAFILSQAAWGMYCLHQNRCEYNGLEKFDKTYIQHMQEYFSISADNILLDEEVSKYLQENDWNNSESFYLYEYDTQPRCI